MVIVIWRTEKLSEIVWRLREASIVVVNLYKISAITPALKAPNSACTGDGGALASTGDDVNAFKLSRASSFNDFSAPDDLNFSSLARLARRRRERKRKTLMEPVSRTLVAVWRKVGESEEAKMDKSEDGSSMGPSSSAGGGAAVVVEDSSATWSIHRLVIVR